MSSTSGVYGFFEDGYLDKDTEATMHPNYTFVCKYFKGKNIKPMTVRAKKKRSLMPFRFLEAK